MRGSDLALIALIAGFTKLTPHIVGVDRLVSAHRWKAPVLRAPLSGPRVSRALGTSCLFYNKGPRRAQMPSLLRPGAAGPYVADGLLAHAVRSPDHGGLDASRLGLEDADDV